MQKNNIALKIAEPAAVILSAVLIVLAGVLGWKQTALISIVVVIFAMVPFFLRFERSRPGARDIVPIVVLSVIAVLGRALFTFVPNVQPVTAIVIVAGLVFGAQAGFLTGALAALTSNMFLGQGPWTPWQMLAWGLIGYAAGLLSKTAIFKKNVFVLILGFVASFLFGWMMNVWHVIGFVEGATWQTFALVYATSIYFDLTHAISTAVFLALIAVPWRKKLERVKTKYGIIEE